MELRSERIEIESGDGRMPAYVSTAGGDGPRSAVIVLMEAFGLVPGLEREVDRIAQMGYVAIAPDVYHREGPDRTASYDDLPKAIAMMNRLDDEAFLEDMRATISTLRGRPDVDDAPIGVIGFCMGGRLAFLAACALPDEVAASAPFYGGGIGALLDRADAIRCPLHLFFGQEDFFIPQDEVRRIDETLRRLGIRFGLENYAGAVHGFCCEERTESYHAAAAADAWSKLEAFLAEHLVRAPRRDG
jgi:carboxymethylenebutenolidase